MAARLKVASASSNDVLKIVERAIAETLSGEAGFNSKWAGSSPRYFGRTSPPMRSALLNEGQISRLEQQLMREGVAAELTLAAQDAADGQWKIRQLAS